MSSLTNENIPFLLKSLIIKGTIALLLGYEDVAKSYYEQVSLSYKEEEEEEDVNDEGARGRDENFYAYYALILYNEGNFLKAYKMSQMSMELCCYYNYDKNYALYELNMFIFAKSAYSLHKYEEALHFFQMVYNDFGSSSLVRIDYLDCSTWIALCETKLSELKKNKTTEDENGIHVPDSQSNDVIPNILSSTQIDADQLLLESKLDQIIPRDSTAFVSIQWVIKNYYSNVLQEPILQSVPKLLSSDSRVMQESLCTSYYKSLSSENDEKEKEKRKSLSIWFNADDWMISGGRSVESGFGPNYYTTIRELIDAIKNAMQQEIEEYE